tara:strand:+ start:129 stop:662 length:534 start_codon:yes stop_codon:yes gene_type:complete
MLVAILFLLKTEEEKTKARIPNVIYEVVLTWDAESADDLDLYVQSASGHVVSFNNREGGQGSLISLDHDALGKRNNSLGQGQEGVIVKAHEEVVSFRAVFDGENIVTVHVYSKRDEEPVKATIRLVKVKPYKEVTVKEITFESTGQEKTAFRFVTDKTGEVVDINELPAKLVQIIRE